MGGWEGARAGAMRAGWSGNDAVEGRSDSPAEGRSGIAAWGVSNKTEGSQDTAWCEEVYATLQDKTGPSVGMQ